jgi:hypothetical protein
VTEGRFSVLLVERDTHPVRGFIALPGGFVQPDEDLDPRDVDPCNGPADGVLPQEGDQGLDLGQLRHRTSLTPRPC